MRPHAERVIAVVRVALAGASLFAIWMDPAEPQRYVELTYGLHSVYLGYALVLAAFMWRRDSSGWIPRATHWADIVLFSVFQYLTLGPSSPFFTYFTFSLFCAALRWGWQETVRTAVLVLLAYVVMGAWLSRTLGPTEFELNRFIVRIANLAVVAVVLVYIGQYEERRRNEVRRLARWPPVSGERPELDVPRLLAHAAGVIGAEQAVLAWNANEEPWLYVASWPSDDHGIERLPPDACEPVVPAPLEGTAFVCRRPLDPAPVVDVSRAGVVTTWRGRPLHALLQSKLAANGLASAGFATDVANGRVFFTGVQWPGGDILTLVEVVGRELGVSLEQSYSHLRARALAIREERLRLARDLHDGVLQSLTGIRLELEAIADANDGHAPPVGDRLIGIERALALEQRELRRFIDDLKPQVMIGEEASLLDRLDDLRRRLALEWKTPIAVHVQPPDLSVPETIAHAVPLMVHEAVVNALKHGKPSRVVVDIHVADGTLKISVADDGSGFAFLGRREHADLAASNAGPVSLRERVTALGGRIDVDSASTGSRVELRLPVEVTHE